MAKYDGETVTIMEKRKRLVDRIEGSTSRSNGAEASTEAHPYSYSDGFKKRNVTKAENNEKFVVPASMRKKAKTYSPEKDKERVLKKVYDGMAVYGKQKKKK